MQQPSGVFSHSMAQTLQPESRMSKPATAPGTVRGHKRVNVVLRQYGSFDGKQESKPRIPLSD